MAYSQQGGYGAAVESPSSADYQLQGISPNDASASASANSGDANSAGYGAPYGYGSNKNIPYSPGNLKGNSVTSSITYPQNKGEILIHRPAPIIVKRPPTKVLVNHPPLVVKPAPVVLHKPPAVVVRKVYVKQHPRPVKVEPVYVNVVKPPAEKYFVKEQNQLNGAPLAPIPNGFAPLPPGGSAGLANLGAPGSVAGAGGVNFNQLDGFQGANALSNANALNNANAAATQSGYKLIPGGQGYSILSGLAPGNAYGQPNNQYNPSGY